MGKFQDLTGMKFGKLTVVGRDKPFILKSGRTAVMWKCKCECGNECSVSTSSLKSGNKKSCGCLHQLDLTGMHFGRLTALEKSNSIVSPKGKKCTIWKCQCECGNIIYARTDLLRNGKTKSCGCLNSEIAMRKSKSHGLSKTHLYNIWCGMVSRCKNKEYSNYGGRGIKVCEEWTGNHGFENFYKWAIKAGYDETKSRAEQSIDRIDVDGDYCPENCRWASYVTQQNNRRNNKLIEYRGEIKTLAEWCRELEIGYSKTELRLSRGWSVKDAFERP